MAPIDHAFIEQKRREIAAIERNARALPNAFFDVAGIRKAVTHTRMATRKAYATRKPAKGGRR